MIGSLRHYRTVLAIDRTGSVSRAADDCHMSQPAVTLALAKMERSLGLPLFHRTAKGLFPTEAGKTLLHRIARTFAILDPALDDLSPRLRLTVSTSQLRALIAVSESESFSAAARKLGLAQPTVHRAISQLERDIGRPILERSLRGVIVARPARTLAEAARLAFAELDQAEVDLADLQGREVGRVVVGAMPLSRACIMGPAIARFRTLRPKVPIRIVDGPFDSLALGLRRGEIDVLVGALRPAETVPEFEQTALFADVMAIVGRPGHPALSIAEPDLQRLAAFPWVLTPPGTPARSHFDALFAASGQVPESLVETGSLVLMREILRQSDHLGFASSQQVATEVDTGMLARLDWPLGHTARPIGLITRRGWVPTRVQSDLIACISAVSSMRQD